MDSKLTKIGQGSGPTVVYSASADKEKAKCSVCKEQVNDGVECEICEHWFHTPCADLSKTTMKALEEDKSLHWYCDGCRKGVVATWKRLKERQDELKEKMGSILKEVEGIEKTQT